MYGRNRKTASKSKIFGETATVVREGERNARRNGFGMFIFLCLLLFPVFLVRVNARRIVRDDPSFTYCFPCVATIRIISRKGGGCGGEWWIRSSASIITRTQNLTLLGYESTALGSILRKFFPLCV